MIPDAAVEAAWSRLAHHFDDTEEESWKDELRLALEAAAPILLSHEREETRLAHVDAVVNAETVDRLEKELAEAEDNCCCGDCGL